MNQTAAVNPQERGVNETRGNGTVMAEKPCPHCGCPYENDHTPDCPAVPLMPVLERLHKLEHEVENLRRILIGVVKECANLAGILGDVGKIMGGEEPTFITKR